MIRPLRAHADMQTAMTLLAEAFGRQIVWFGDDVGEIRWDMGVPTFVLNRGKPQP